MYEVLESFNLKNYKHNTQVIFQYSQSLIEIN